MKLKSGCIFWPQIYPEAEPQFPSLANDIKCDVAIIGGGISGALIGYHLAREGIETVMVERHQVGHGSTAASTGLLQYEIDTPLVDLAKKIRKDRAIAAYRASLDALLAFEPLVADLGDDCALIARPSLYLASKERDVQRLLTECEARRAMQLDVEFLSRDALHETFKVSRPAALLSSRAFEIDPFRLTLKLIARAAEKGMQVFAQTQISGYEAQSDGVVLLTSSGARLKAKKVVFATGYEPVAPLPRELCRLSSTYAIASEKQANFENWPGRCMIWESARPYLYMRTTSDDRIIVGGEDEEIVDPYQRDALLESKANLLREKFSHLFPAINIDVNCVWAGTFAETKDGLPYIGTRPQFPHGYFALGYGGNGITFSLLAAEILRDLFLGKRTERTELFGFSR